MSIKAALLTSLVVCGVVNIGGFCATAATKSHKLTDLMGTTAFIASATMSVQKLAGPLSGRQLLLYGATAAWSARLGSYLFYRVLMLGEDKRLRFLFPKDDNEGWLNSAGSMFPVKLAGFWTIQTFWAFLSMVPTTVALSRAATAAPLLSSPAGLLSAGLVAGGLALESVADWQKFQFKQAHPDQFMQTGVWSWCRYPNYSGEIMFWLGMYGLAFPLIPGTPARLLSLASPLFVYYLLTNVSGIPMLEGSQMKRYGHLASYQAYVRTTNLLVPNPFK